MPLLNIFIDNINDMNINIDIEIFSKYVCVCMHNIYTHTFTKMFIYRLKALILMHKLQQNTYRGIFRVFQGTCTEQHFHNKVNVQ